MAKVKIALEPYNAVSILAFLREFVNDENKNDYQFRALHEAVQEFENECAQRLTDEQWQEVQTENKVNRLIGKSPDNSPQ